MKCEDNHIAEVSMVDQAQIFCGLKNKKKENKNKCKIEKALRAWNRMQVS